MVVFMNKTSRKTSASVKAAAAIVIIAIIIVGAYAAWTYPRTVLSLPVSFSIGATAESQPFEVPFLDGQVRVQVSVNSGVDLWTARIANDNETQWTHTASQGGETTYDSGWMTLQSGPYNFTFAITGGSLSAQVTVSSKGGFW